MKILAAGTTTTDPDLAFRTLDKHHKRTPITLLVTTVDFLAARAWAERNDVRASVYEPKPEHGSVGPALMNQAILRDDRPAVVLAFPGGKETGDLVNRAMMAKVPVYAVVNTSAFKKVSTRRLGA